MKIYVVGPTGMLGHVLCKTLEPHYEVVPITGFDFRQRSYIEALCGRFTGSEIVVNCCGLLRQRLPKEPLVQDMIDAFMVNSVLPQSLAKCCRLLHISTDCFSAGTKVLTDNGWRTIERIKVGDCVVTHEGRLRRVYKVICRNNTDVMLNIKTQGNDWVKCTSNHPFYSIKRKYKESIECSPDWQLAKDLEEGCLIAVPKNIPTSTGKTKTVVNMLDYCRDWFDLQSVYKSLVEEYWNLKEQNCLHRGDLMRLSQKYSVPYKRAFSWIHEKCQPWAAKSQSTTFAVDEDTMWLMGLFLAEGWSESSDHRSAVFFCFGDENDLVNRCQQILLDKIGVRSSIKSLNGQKGKHVIAYSRTLSSFFSSFYYGEEKYSHTKKIPEWIMHLDQHLLKAFVKGYFEGDGCYYSKDRSCFVNFHSVSEGLIDDLKVILMRLGFYASKTAAAPVEFIQERRVNSRESFNLDISGKQVGRFIEMFDLPDGSFYEFERYQRFFEDDKYWYVPIQEIEDCPVCENVYNLEVEEDHSYIVDGGLCAHNCVFSGNRGGYVETDLPDAEDIYGRTKALGDPPGAMIIRTSIIGKETHRYLGLYEWFQKVESANGFTNHLWNGLTTNQLSKCILAILKEGWRPGLSHVFSDIVSKYELLCEFNKYRSSPAVITPVEASVAVDRTLSTLDIDFVKMCSIPDLEYQIKEMCIGD